MVTRQGNGAPALDAGPLRDLGGAMRARRHQLGLTLADVSAGTGLSVPFLSQIETSSATPSLTSLFSIAQVLDTTPERLLAGPGPAEVVLTRGGEGQQYPVTDADRSGHRRQLTGLGEPFSVAEYVVEPGADLGGFHSSAGRELLHVTAGRLLVDLDDGGTVTSHELAAGDSLVYPTSVLHRWRHTRSGHDPLRPRRQPGLSRLQHRFGRPDGDRPRVGQPRRDDGAGQGDQRAQQRRPGERAPPVGEQPADLGRGHLGHAEGERRRAVRRPVRRRVGGVHDVGRDHGREPGEGEPDTDRRRRSPTAGVPAG